ncbi:hypothetical protein GLI01_18410 [Gluconacetobacter liquefaciens]|nr:hypothetical protein GLI01_18410 [Gluconacetobacter liquefaciens]
MPPERIGREISQRIVSRPAHKPHIGAQPGRRDGLIGAFAAQTEPGIVCMQGFARNGKVIHACADVDIDASERDD